MDKTDIASTDEQDTTPPLAQALEDYLNTGRRRFHVPGHAGQAFFTTPALSEANYRYDLTEVEGLDVLSCPEPDGCLLKAQQVAARTLGVAHTFFLVNGASVGLQAAMLSTLRPGDQVLVPRNVHRSVISGLILTGAIPVWCLPECHPDWGLWGELNPETVQQVLQNHPHLKAVMVTSPTYEGLGSDIHAIATLCRQSGAYLIVDEAHGSLWPFSNALPESACYADCDVVIHSYHKSAGSLTQSAMAHLPLSSTLQPEVFQQALNTLQTTSPSYLLLASLEASQHYLSTSAGQARIHHLITQSAQLREQLEPLKHFRVFEPENPRHWDSTRIVLQSDKEPGTQWATRIEAERQIAYESATPFHALYVCGLGLEPDDYQFFIRQFQAEDDRIAPLPQHHAQWQPPILPDMALSPRDAFFTPGERLSKSDCLARIAKETIVHCPPGIPILLPGEVIQPAHLALLPDHVSVIRI